jgi:hypothetical protein
VIPVAPASPPADFGERVRARGLNAIAELAGEIAPQKRGGPKRKKNFGSREAIPSDEFPPYWRDVLPDMRRSYNGICAYLSLYLHSATGSSSVDHFVPKSKAWDKVYEWSNYRLAAALINSKKKDLDLSLDPFTIDNGLFALELVEFQVVPGPAAKGPTIDQVLATRDVLGLNMPECCDLRREYVEDYEKGEIIFSYLERRAPFIALELRRQGRLLRGDL